MFTEFFIEEFSDRVDWSQISIYQDSEVGKDYIAKVRACFKRTKEKLDN